MKHWSVRTQHNGIIHNKDDMQRITKIADEKMNWIYTVVR